MKILKSAFGKKEQDPKPNNSFTIDEQFMTPEFLYKPNKQEDGIKKLSKQFFLSLSTLENSYNLQSVKSHSLVQELVTMYQECVQVYDGQMDPIKYYFIDKIKQLLTSAEKFIGRNQSVSQYVQSSQNIIPKLEQKPFFKEFEDFAEKHEQVTEFATPRNEEMFARNTKHEEILKKIDFQQQKIQQQQQELYSIKETKSQIITPQIIDRQQPTTVQTSLQNQEQSIQARLLLRQKKQKKEE